MDQEEFLYIAVRRHRFSKCRHPICLQSAKKKNTSFLPELPGWNSVIKIDKFFIEKKS
jgi:hypothetical protein